MPHHLRLRALAYGQLLRLPNVFTAFADIAVATTAAIAFLPTLPESFWASAILLGLTSGCLYLAGMVWNDLFDRHEDLRTRPFRPIPSGRIRVRAAALLGVCLITLGLLLAAFAGQVAESSPLGAPLGYAIAIVIAVLAYDGGLKRTAFGPVAMGTCRLLNVLLGLSIVPLDVMPLSFRLHLAGVVGLYIVGVTWFARTEEGTSQRQSLRGAASVMALSLVLALVLRSRLPAESGTVAFPYLLVLFSFIVGRPLLLAIRNPTSRQVQLAIKRSVLGLIALDAVLATAFVGLPGLAILLLLPPAIVIGKWVYST